MPRLTPYRTALAEEGVLRDLDLDGYRYCVADLGSGPPLVLLHGLGGSIYDWRHLLRPLAADHRVVAVDLLGAGESDKPPAEDYSVAAQARRLRGLLDALEVGPAVLVGNSFGGGVALSFAQDWPDRVRRLALLNSICYAERIPGYVRLARLPGAQAMAGRIPLGDLTRWVLRSTYRTVGCLSEDELEDYLAEIRAEGRRRAIVRTLCAVVPPDTREFESRIRSIRAPALVLWGREDATVPLELGIRLSRELPDARLVELDAGHVPHQERPREVLRELRAFLACDTTARPVYR